MTAKQYQILKAALQLFSEEGYHATSTSKVAKSAGVSEGLIFRHFKNKNGLLDSTINEIELRVNQLLQPILNEENPKKVIRKTIELLFNIDENDLKCLKLQLKLKWELDNHEIETLESLKPCLKKAFAKLRYRTPELETEYLIQHLNGLTAAIIKDSINDKKTAKVFLLRKYYL